MEANPGLTYGRNEDYVASIKTDQYNLESSAQDQYPANPAGVPTGQVYLEDGQTTPMFAYMNGDGDKDGFKIHYPGRSTSSGQKSLVVPMSMPTPSPAWHFA